MNKLIRYYKACYEADNRSLGLSNFFSQKVENRAIIDGKEELINKFLPHIPIENKKAEAAQRILQLYQKEKQLYYFSSFIIGKIEGIQSKTQKIIAPLFIYPAEIIESREYFYLSINFQDRILNQQVLSILKSENDKNALDLDDFIQKIPKQEIGFKEIGDISRLMKNQFGQLNVEPILAYPDLWTEKEIKSKTNSRNLEKLSGFQLVPASAWGIIKKSKNTLGVLTELEEISKEKIFSKAINCVFRGYKSSNLESFSEIQAIPVVLNLAQEKILKEANFNDLNVIVGPPGTGKSFTIAALAIEQMQKGKSVLIVSKNDEAVDVINKKIENDLEIKNVVVRGGKNHTKNLKNKLVYLLSGIKRKKIKQNNSTISKLINELEFELNHKINLIQKLEIAFDEKIEKEINRGKFVSKLNTKLNIIEKIRFNYIKWRNKKEEPIWKIVEKQIKEETEKINRIRNYIELIQYRKIENSISDTRHELQNMLSALRARTLQIQEERFKKINFYAILKTFPIWLVNLNDIHKILPLKYELFDIAIIDEATQCDIASCIPIFQRAKKVVICGDPKQLRHVSFLARSKQREFQQKYQLENYEESMLDFRENSILDLVMNKIENQKQITFLNEHYRSLPQIIDFSNQYFYNNALRIMRSLPKNKNQKGLEIIHCKGKRNKSGFNEIEANKLTADVLQVIENQKDKEKEYCQSIGILSPFRGQVDFISKIFNEKLALETMQKHDLMIGTAHSFQGEERDLMFISFCIDDESHATAFRHLNEEAVFNVSITRAKTFQKLYVSTTISKLKPSLFRQYLENVQNFKSNKKVDLEELEDDFVQEVKSKIENEETKVSIAYPIAGLEIDLLVQYKNKTFGIDLIGYPGRFEAAFSLERYKILARAGLKIFALPYTYWKINKEKCLTAVNKFLQPKDE